MGWVQSGTTLGRVLVDVNTQADFLDSDGRFCVRNREALIPRLRRLMSTVRVARLPVISAVEVHRPTDSFYGMPLHCLTGSPGQLKVPFTLLSPRVVVEADNSFDLPYNVMSRYRQVIFAKQDSDFFANPKADRLLTELEPQQYVVFGVGLERWIKAIALGLLARHKKVAVIADACGYWVEADADLALRQLRAKGIELLTVDELAAAATLPRRRIVRAGRPAARHHPAARTVRRPRGERRESMAP